MWEITTVARCVAREEKVVRLEDEVVGQTDGGMDLEVNKVDREK